MEAAAALPPGSDAVDPAEPGRVAARRRRPVWSNTSSSSGLWNSPAAAPALPPRTAAAAAEVMPGSTLAGVQAACRGRAIGGRCESVAAKREALVIGSVCAALLMRSGNRIDSSTALMLPSLALERLLSPQLERRLAPAVAGAATARESVGRTTTVALQPG